MPTTALSVDHLSPAEIAELRAEVIKWQERVPKLAAALRERTEELAGARDQIRLLENNAAQGPAPQGQDESVDARLHARDQVIQELEDKVASLSTAHRQSAGELHALKMEIQTVQEASAGWKDKWQAVTQSLDEAVAKSTDVTAELEQQTAGWQARETELQQQHQAKTGKLQHELDSLQQRNQSLQLTMGMLNDQLESAGGELTQTAEQLELARQAVREKEQSADELAAAAAQKELKLSEEISSLAEDKATLQAEQNTLREQHQQQVQQLQAANRQLQETRQQISSLQHRLDATEEQGAKDLAAAAQQAADEITRAQQNAADEIAGLKRKAQEDIAAAHRQAEENFTNAKKQAADEVDKARQQAAAEVEAVKQQAAGQVDAARQQAADDIVAHQRASQQEIQALKQQVEAAEQLKADALAEAIRQAEADLAEAHQTTQRQVEVLNARLEKLVAEKDEMTAQLAELAPIKQNWEQNEAAMQARVDQAEKSKHELAVEFHNLVAANSRLEAENTRLAEEKPAAEQNNSTPVAHEQEITQLEQAMAQQQAENANLKAEVAALQNVHANAGSGPDTPADAGAEDAAEVARLTTCLEQAQQAMTARDNERRELGEQVRTLTLDNNKLKNNLDDRSALVRQLEQELLQQAQQLKSTSEQGFSDDQAQLQRQLLEEQRRVDTFKNHAQILEEKLSNQQGLMEEVERELSDAHNQAARHKKNADNYALQAQTERQALEEKLRDALQRVDNHQMQNEALQQSVTTSQAVIDDLNNRLSTYLQGGHNPEVDPQHQKLPELESRLEVLSRELADERVNNERLQAALAEATRVDDDFTRIKGIGEKLAEQLGEAGFTTFAQLAELTDTLLSNESHPLHQFRSRALRDEWAEQAAELISAQANS